jgi:hypothetical protein
MRSTKTVTVIDRNELAREITIKIEGDPEVQIKTKAFAEEVRAWWADVEAPKPGPDHPYSQGGPTGYAESIKVLQNRDAKGQYAAGWTVETKHRNANFIEEGTGIDKPGSKSPWGPFTPTPPFHPAAKTAIHFRGTAP